MTDIHYIQSGAHKIAYEHSDGTGPAVIYVPGHRNTMEGNTRQPYFRDSFQKSSIPFIAFDYAGYGLSGDEKGVWQVEPWTENIVDLIDHLPHQKYILVGHSMGGYLMLLAALARPERVCGLVGMAAGFGSYIQKTGKTSVAHASSGKEIHVKLAGDPGKEYHAIAQPLDLSMPVRLIHAFNDDTVHYQSSISIMEHAVTSDAELNILKDGDHRMERHDLLDHVVQAAKKLHARDFGLE